MQESLDWDGVSRADTRRSHRDGVGEAQYSQGDVIFMGRGSNGLGLTNMAVKPDGSRNRVLESSGRVTSKINIFNSIDTLRNRLFDPSGRVTSPHKYFYSIDTLPMVNRWTPPQNRTGPSVSID